MGKQNKSDQEILNVLAETPLASLIFHMKSGKFVDFIHEEVVGQDETVIGELTLFEKALFSAANEQADNLNKMAEAHNARASTMMKEEIKKNKDAYCIEYEMHESLMGTLWVSIRKRLPQAATTDSIGIRKGFLIVDIKREEEDKMPIPVGMVIISI